MKCIQALEAKEDAEGGEVSNTAWLEREYNVTHDERLPLEV
jgi:hypothetical protein